MDVARDIFQVVLDCEMSCVKPMHFRFGQVLQICLSTFFGEENVILSPEDDCFGLSLA